MTENREPEHHAPVGDGIIIDAAAHGSSRVHEPRADQQKEPASIEFLADTPLKINVVLAETSVPLGEVLALGTDSVVQLNKPSGDPVDIYVGNQRLGKGEVLVLQEKLRIRVLEITPPSGNSGKTGHGRPEGK